MGRVAGVATCLAALLLVLGACAGEPTVRVTGSLIDAETGEAVPRKRIFVHAFNDATGHQVSLRPDGTTSFELEMPAPEIRLRIPDLEHGYELFEEDFVAVDGALHVDVSLQPTHWVRMHGTVLWRDADGKLRPLAAGDPNVRSAQLSANHGVRFFPDASGRYTVRAPRKLLRVLSINTNYVHEPREVDLRGVEADDFEFDLVLAPHLR
jgi:hypothetical protein